MKRRQHQVTCQRGLDGDFSRFSVANLSHHYDVGILPKDRPKHSGKIKSLLFIYLDLTHRWKLKFHGVLDRHGLSLHGADECQPAIECRGFTATGGTGNKQEPVGPFQQALYSIERVRIETDLIDVQRQALLVQKPQNDVLAVDRGHTGDSDVYFFAFGKDLNAPVLGQSPFGDVHIRHNLDSRNDRRV